MVVTDLINFEISIEAFHSNNGFNAVQVKEQNPTTSQIALIAKNELVAASSSEAQML